MARSGVTAFSFAVLLALIEIGSCKQRCYQCNSQSDPKCGDPFTPNQNVMDCESQDSVNFNRNYLQQLLPHELLLAVPGAPRQCHKIVMQSGTVIRTCLDVNPSSQTTCDILKRSMDQNKQSKYCSMCDKDLCNGAGSVSVSLPLAFAAAIATYLYSKQ